MHPILVRLWLFQFQIVPTLWLLLWITSVTYDTNAMSVVVDSKHRTIPPPPPNTMVITKIPSISMPVWSLACSTKALSSLSIENDSTTTTTNTTATPTPTTATAGATATTKEPPPLPLPTMSMNIVTFTTAVSVAAPKLYILSLYYHTLTKDAFIASGFGILQLLRPHQQHLVPILGQHSGYDNTMMNYYSKRIECERMGYPWVSTYVNCHQSNDDKQQQQQQQEEEKEEDDSFTLDLLPNCATYLHVKIVHRFDSSGTSRTATGTSSTSTAATLPAGDHLVVLCEVVATFQWDETTQTIIPTSWTNDDNHKPPSLDATNVLYTGQLRQEGII